MKRLKEFINEALYKLNDKVFAHWLIKNVDYKIVYDILNDHIDNVIKSYETHPNEKFYDFQIINPNIKNTDNVNDSESYYVIFYKVLYRKEGTIDFAPNELKNGKLNIPKLPNKSFIGFIYDNKLYIIAIDEINNHIKNYKLNIKSLLEQKLEYKFEYDLDDKQRKIYNDIYNIYDNLSPNQRQSK